MSILATSTPEAHGIPGDMYVCKRCGIVKAKGGGNRNAEYCADCQPEAAALGWIPPLKTWDRKKKTGVK